MQTIKIDINKVTLEQIDLIVDYLKRGQVIAYPTDTIYGLGCDARNPEAIKKIKEIKGREKNGKAMIILVSDFVMLKRYCLVSEEQEKYLKKIWGEKPHPTLSLVRRGPPITVILERRTGLLSDELTGGLDSLGVRLPDNEFLVKMISKAGFPIVSTSLNKTGESPLNDARNLEKHFERLSDLAVDAGESESAKPSRLVDLRDVKNVKVLRE